MALVKINRRTYFIEGVRSVTRVSPSRFRIETNQGTYLAIGGRRAGGAANEWWVQQDGGTDLINGQIACNSLVACVRAIAQI